MSSTVTISYNSLREAASEAKQVATKCTEYANDLNRSVYNKLNGYSGNHTGNITSAMNNIRKKTAELEKKSRAYTNYANDLLNLKGKCESTDRTVRTMVSQLTASFKSANGIRNSKVENTINYFLTGLSNSTVVGRWLTNTVDKGDSIKNYIKQSLKEWWGYEGGKELVKGGVIALLEIVGGVCCVIAGIATILAGGTVLAIIAAVAGVVVGVIAAVNGVVNLVNEGRAYDQTHNNENPALGSRLSNENTLQDYLRKETDSPFWHNFATGIDIVNVVCSVITFVSGVGNLIKSAYKWTTGSMVNIKNLKVKDILTKKNFSDFFQKVKTTFKKSFAEIGKAVKGNFTNIKNFGKNLKTDFINNLKEFKKDYINFSSVKDGAETIENWSSISKTLISGDFGIKAIFIDGLLNTVVLPNITLAKIPSEDKTKNSNISIADITKKISTIKGFFKSGKNLYEHWFGASNKIDKKLLKKLSKVCEFSISIPKVHVPTIDVKVA